MATKRENLASLQKRAEKATTAFSEKGIKRRKRVSIIYALGILFALGLGLITTSGERNQMYEKYLEDSSAIDFEFLRYEDTFLLWNDNDIGNDVNVLLSGGRIYSRDNLSIIPDELTYSIIQNGKTVGTINTYISYINVVNDTIIYRDDSTRKIHAYSLHDGSDIIVSNDNCGEVFVSNGLIYYVSYTDNSSIVCIDKTGANKQIVVNEPVANFLVCGDNVVYLTNLQNLNKYAMSSDTKTSLISNVECFFVNGDLIVESGDLIFTCHTNGNKAEEVYRSDDPSMHLVCASDNEIFYQEGGKLYSIKGGSADEIEGEGYELYSSVIRQTDAYLLIAYQNKSNVATVPQLITLDAQ